MTENVNLSGADQEVFHRLVHGLVSPQQLVQLEAGSFDVGPIRDMYKALQRNVPNSRGQVQMPASGSHELEYARCITNAFLRGGITGVTHQTSLKTVIFKLLGRDNATGSVGEVRHLLRRSGLRGVSGSCRNYEQEYDAETLWKLLFVLLQKRDYFINALGADGVEVLDEDAADDDDEEAELHDDLEPDEDLLPGWRAVEDPASGQRYYCNDEGAARWTRPRLVQPWVCMNGEGGRVYYVNPSTNEERDDAPLALEEAV